MPSSPVATFIATALMGILAIVAVVPSATTQASTANITAPADIILDAPLTVVGANFAAQQRGSLVLDDGSVLAEFKATRTGGFSIVTAIPASVSVGHYNLLAIASTPGRPPKDTTAGSVLASTALEVLAPSDGVASPTPAPIASPAPIATPVATPASIATPVATPAPIATTQPTAVPTPSATAAPTATPAAAPTVTPATGCTFTEAQAWWTTTPGKTGTDFGHLHVGTCSPWKQTVSGVFEFDVRLIMHDNPGEFAYINPVLKTDSQELSLDKTYIDWTCEGTCERWVTLTVDTRLSDYDGIQEIRIRAFVDEPDGNRMHASLNMLVNIQNGDPENPIDRKAYQRFKGWYTDSGYCEPDILTDIPVGPIADWRPTVQIVHHGSSEDLAVSRYVIAIDANAHHGIPGTVIAQGNGELQPTQLDLSGLPPGVHRLSMRAECDDPSGSTNVGVGVATFTVP